MVGSFAAYFRQINLSVFAFAENQALDTRRWRWLRERVNVALVLDDGLLFAPASSFNRGLMQRGSGICGEVENASEIHISTILNERHV